VNTDDSVVTVHITAAVAAA